MNGKPFSRSNFSETQMNSTSIPLIRYITKAVFIEGYFESAMIEDGSVGSVCKLHERAIDSVDRMVELSSWGAVEQACKNCEAGMAEAYIVNDDDSSVR